MVTFRLFPLTALALGVTAQVSFGAPENSGQIADLLKDANQATLKVAVADAAAAVQQRTRAKDLTPLTLAFLNIGQDYSNTQEIQQFGPQTPIYKGQCGCSSIPQV
ncbi:hypothetical protein BST61_g6855 [Cercospora zeina]